MAGRVGALWFDVADRGDDGALFDSVVRFITFLLLRLDDDRQAAAELSALAPRQDASGGVVLPVLLTNTGNVHLTPTGRVAIRDARSGRLVDELYLVEGTSLPQCPRSYAAVWVGDRVEDGEYDAEFAVAFGGMLPEQSVRIRFSVKDGLLLSGGM